jgi:hypothetical protein
MQPPALANNSYSYMWRNLVTFKHAFKLQAGRLRVHDL